MDGAWRVASAHLEGVEIGQQVGGRAAQLLLGPAADLGMDAGVRVAPGQEILRVVQRGHRRRVWRTKVDDERDKADDESEGQGGRVR